MQPAAQTGQRSIEVTGLPEEAIRALEALVAALRSQGNPRLAHASTAPKEASYADWKKKFDAWMAQVQARAQRYPPGFVMDDSRESIYQGCGE